MPYITQTRRDALKEDGLLTENPGELNYFFTMMAKDYLDRKGLSYQTLNDVIGALECCKQELYRRVAVPYENNKLSVNGDVY